MLQDKLQHCLTYFKMNQIELSETVKIFLLEKYPEFSKTLKYNQDGSFDCDLRSPSNEFSIWLGTFNAEISIGLEDPDGKTEIHTHISCDTEEDIPTALEDLSKMIDDITNGKTILYYSNQDGYDWTSDINEILNQKKTLEAVRVYSWKK